MCCCAVNWNCWNVVERPWELPGDMQHLPDVARESLLTFLSRMTMVLVSIPAAVIVARALGPGGKGVYSLIILLPTILAQLGMLGIDQAVVFHTSSNVRKEVVASSALVAAVIQGAILWGAAHLLVRAGIVPQSLDDSALRIAMITLPVLLVLTYSTNVLLGAGFVEAFAFVGVSQTVIQLVLVVFFLFVLALGLQGAVVAWTLTVVLTGALSTCLVLQRVGFGRPDTEMLSRLCRFGSRSFITSVFDGLIKCHVEIYLLAAIGGAAIVGVYTVGRTLAGIFYQLPLAIATVVTPRVALSQDQDNMTALTVRIIRFLVLVSGVAFLLLLILGYPLIVGLFGKEFASSYHVLIVIFPAVAVLGMGRVFSGYYVGLGKPALASRVSLITVLTLFGGTAAAGTLWGAWGAIAGVAFSYWLSFLMWTLLFSRQQSVALRVFVPGWHDVVAIASLFKEGMSWISVVLHRGAE